MRFSLGRLRAALTVATISTLSLAQAAIWRPDSGNSELIFLVRDPVAQVSYTLDLGIRVDDFFVLAQQNAGYQRFWLVDSPTFDSFLSQVSNAATLEWAVLGFDSVGPSTAGGRRLFTTVKQGSEARIAGTPNQNFANAVSSGNNNAFFDLTNETPSHGSVGNNFAYEINGESIARADSPISARAYFGNATGLTPSYNNSLPFDSINLVGRSSWFYHLTRSGTGNLPTNRVLVDEFDNGNPSDGGNDGFWGFTRATDPATTLPEWVGKYLLSFTMPAFSPVLRAETRSFASSIGRTEYSAGFWTETLLGMTAAFGLESPFSAAISLRVGAASALSGDPGLPALLGPVTAVPEPRSAGLLLLGLAALCWATRGRNARPKPVLGSTPKTEASELPGSA